MKVKKVAVSVVFLIVSVSLTAQETENMANRVIFAQPYGDKPVLPVNGIHGLFCIRRAGTGRCDRFGSAHVHKNIGRGYRSFRRMAY